MISLKSFESCPYGDICPYSSGCKGLDSNRTTNFVCEFICFENGKPYFSRDINFNKNEHNIKGSNKKILHG